MGIPAAVLAETGQRWKPLWEAGLARRKRLGLPPLENEHWDWSAKSDWLSLAAYRSLGVECEGTMQGLISNPRIPTPLLATLPPPGYTFAMATKPIHIWCNMSFPAPTTELLRDRTRDHSLVFSANLQTSNLVAGQPDPALAEADVAFGQPDPSLILDSPKLKWVHLTSAGYDRYDRADLREAFEKRGALLTNSSTVYAEPCAEHVFSMILALARRLPQALDNQRTQRAWPITQLRADSHLLLGQTALILGYGAIARRLIEMLVPFRMNVSCIRRTPKGDEPVPTFPESELPRLLPTADHVINILPGGASTNLFTNAARFEQMKPTAIFYNIGRGSTVDQAALLSALTSARLAAAYLDVMTPEPLPPDHPLWTTPNCFITPHTAGGQAEEHRRLVEHFLDNLGRFIDREELVDRVI
jgi:phosphoglycerate dehydrogenase-like enzyme